MKNTFILLFFFMSFCVFAQDKQDKTETEVTEVKVKAKAKTGTYQFIVSTKKFDFIFTDEAFVSIEEKRKENEDITIHLNQFVDVFIPSRQAINAKGFLPLPQYLYK